MADRKIVLLDAGTLGNDIDLSVFEQFGEVTSYEKTSPDLVRERTANADIIIVNKVKCNKETLGNDTTVKMISIAATGFDNVDLDFCREKGIAVCNVPSYSSDSVAQLTAAMVFSLSVNLKQFTDYVSSGEYSKSGVANKLTPVYHDVAGKKWGIVGFGGIGQKVAKIAEAAGCEVMVCRKHPKGEPYETDIDTLCKECDIISLHTPLNDSTKHLINKERLDMMKENVILVNVARGAVVDEAEVAKAVLSKKIAAFAADVYSTEPFSEDHPYSSIAKLPNVCFTPHMAWGSYESRIRCVNVMSENITSFLTGARKNRID